MRERGSTREQIGYLVAVFADHRAMMRSLLESNSRGFLYGALIGDVSEAFERAVCPALEERGVPRARAVRAAAACRRIVIDACLDWTLGLDGRGADELAAAIVEALEDYLHGVAFRPEGAALLA